MSELDKELALQWMEKARHDLFTARRVLDAEDAPTDTPCFHAQQTVEKTLKAILTAAGVRYERGPRSDAALGEVSVSGTRTESISRGVRTAF